jgi:hypothetical protein
MYLSGFLLAHSLEVPADGTDSPPQKSPVLPDADPLKYALCLFVLLQNKTAMSFSILSKAISVISISRSFTARTSNTIALRAR